MRFRPGFGYGQSGLAVAQIRFRPKHYAQTPKLKLARTVTLALAVWQLGFYWLYGGQGGAYASWYRRPET